MTLTMQFSYLKKLILQDQILSSLRLFKMNYIIDDLKVESSKNF